MPSTQVQDWDEVNFERAWNVSDTKDEREDSPRYRGLVRVERAGRTQIAEGVAIDPKRVVSICPMPVSGEWIVFETSGQRHIGRYIAGGPRQLCLLEIEGMITTSLHLQIRRAVTVGQTLHTRTSQEPDSSWKQSRIEQLQRISGGQLITTEPVVPSPRLGQALFDDGGYLVGVYSLLEGPGGVETAVTLDWLLRELLAEKPCIKGVAKLAAMRYEDSPLPPEFDDGPRVPKDRQSHESMKRFILQIRHRIVAARNPAWYPAEARELGMEGRRDVRLRFTRDGKHHADVLGSAPDDALSRGVREWLACTPMPEVPHDLLGKELDIVMPIVFRLQKGERI
ncbi:MAG: hypothetical protein ACKVQA_10220 [Burkholderiales bacterium]